MYTLCLQRFLASYVKILDSARDLNETPVGEGPLPVPHSIGLFPFFYVASVEGAVGAPDIFYDSKRRK